MMYVMDDIAFGTFALDVAKDAAPFSEAEYYNGTLFVKGCSPREASKMQSAFECNGIGVIVTPGNEYSFDFV